MSRKHFITLAEKLNNVRPTKPGPELETWKQCVRAVALSCNQHNFNFSYDRFYTACGVHEDAQETT